MQHYTRPLGAGVPAENFPAAQQPLEVLMNPKIILKCAEKAVILIWG